ncbi:MAG: hypothetical protein HQL49_12455, partial [Gammaproteobacteria bacterium]|nr:hypothetical protein [Gammaproteobacteria bacterium]
VGIKRPCVEGVSAQDNGHDLGAEVCYRVGYIDSWGRGIEKITDACKAAGLPEPIIEEN